VDVKEKKRAPSAYNLFVKAHMKAYLADNPGKTNKDAMKHVCRYLCVSSISPINMSRLAHFGKMHLRTPSVVRKQRRRLPRQLSGQRKLQQTSLLPKVLRSSQVAMNRCLVGFMFLPFLANLIFWSDWVHY
jgi:hypothetical protein